MTVFNETGRLSVFTEHATHASCHVITAPNALQYLVINEIALDVFVMRQIAVSWTIQDTVLDVDDFLFFVERAGSPEGPFKRMHAAGLKNVFQYIDADPPDFGKDRRIYYRIAVLKPDENKVAYSSPKNYYNAPDYTGLEIALRYKLLLKAETGTPCVIHKRKKWGERCSVCWDAQLRRGTKSDCENCFNTGFKNGYWDPIDVHINLSAGRLIIRQTPWGKTEPNALTAWFGNYPLVEPQDVITELAGNRRWMIKNVSNTEKKRIPLKQVMLIEELNKRRAEYLLPIQVI